MSINLDEKINYASRYAGYQKRWLCPDDLEQEYGFSKSSQAKMRMTKNGSKIPFSKVGRYIRYDRNLINAWLEAHAITK